MSRVAFHHHRRVEPVRLERAMVAGRRWSAADFDAFLVRHPLVGHLVRSLVWGTYAGEKLVATFRVAEDASLASIDDTAFVLKEGLAVAIVHPRGGRRGLRHGARRLADRAITGTPRRRRSARRAP